MSSPSSRTSPAVGSMSRVRQRISVDLPEPDRPITTNTSPGRTSKRDVADGDVGAGGEPQLVTRQLGERRADDLVLAGAEDLPQALDRDRRLVGRLLRRGQAGLRERARGGEGRGHARRPRQIASGERASRHERELLHRMRRPGPGRRSAQSRRCRQGASGSLCRLRWSSRVRPSDRASRVGARSRHPPPSRPPRRPRTDPGPADTRAPRR